MKRPIVKHPNILWLMTDEQRCDSIGAYGSTWAVTPVLDRLAARGVIFRSAYTPSPVCVSARACLLTGRAASSLGVLNNHHRLRPRLARFLPQVFSRAGYQVASFGKVHVNCPVPPFDVQGGRVLGDRVHYFRYEVDVDEKSAGVVRYPRKDRQWIFAGRYPGDVSDTPEAANVSDALTWLQDRDRDRPFFLRLSLNAPHTPVVAPPPYDCLIDPAAIDLPSAEWDVSGVRPAYVDEYFMRYASAGVLSADQIARARQCYYGLTACVDRQLGILLDTMDAFGDLDGTLVVMVSDHGCHLGEKGFFQKQSFFEASVRVPFIISGEGVPCGVTVDAPVSTGSLLPTLLSCSGLDVPRDIDFADLSGCFTGTPIAAEPVFSEIDYGIWGDYRDGDRCVMVRQGPWKLSLFRDPEKPDRLARDDGQLLFNLERDPGELRNVADAAHAGLIQRLIQVIDQWDRNRTLTPPVHVNRGGS